MKILLVSHYFWPEPFRINQLAADLVADGAEVVVLTGHPSYPEGVEYPDARPWTIRRERFPEGYEVVRIPVVPRGRSNALRLALNYVSFVVSGLILAPWLLRKFRFEAIFVFCTTPVTQGLIAIWLKFMRRVPVVQWIQDIWPEALSATGYLQSPRVLAAIGKVTGWMYRRSDLILGQSHSFVDILRSRAGEVPVEYFPNQGEHPPARALPPVAMPMGRNIVFAGNIGRAQAMPTVVEAAALLDGEVPVRIVLIGSGSMAEWVAAEIDRRGLGNLLLAGRHPGEAMPATFRTAFALLLPLTDDPAVSQTVPSKLQSYLAAGRPVIAAVNGDAARLVEEAGAGVTCPAESPQALADAIRALAAHDDEELAAMGRSGRLFYDRNYEPRAMSQALHRRLRELAGVDGGPGAEGAAR